MGGCCLTINRFATYFSESEHNIDPYFFLPIIWEEFTDKTNFHGWNFLKPLIGRKVFWASVNWENCQEKNLPPGYRAYVVKTEGPNMEWIEQQSQKVDAPIFYCCLYRDYGSFDHLPNVNFVPVIEWHYQLASMIKIFGAKVTKNLKHKVSALCHRQTQSKILALAALAQHVGLENCLISLHSWQEHKNVHGWELTNNILVDQYIKYFVDNFKDSTFLIDKFVNQDLIQVHNFHHKAYLDSAININNETFSYSHMYVNNKARINPGPFITEKTLKCLLSETAFINNGQFDTYETLSSLGFKFDYSLDLEYDKDPGNLGRITGMINLIKNLSSLTNEDIYDQTRDACLHNKNHVISGEFFNLAETVNNTATEIILSKL